jgi:hypothetical protein
MYRFAFERRTPDERLPPRLDCLSFLDFAIGGSVPETDGEAVDVIFQEKDAYLLGRTKSRRGFCDEHQYLLQIEN